MVVAAAESLRVMELVVAGAGNFESWLGTEGMPPTGLMMPRRAPPAPPLPGPSPPQQVANKTPASSSSFVAVAMHGGRQVLEPRARASGLGHAEAHGSVDSMAAVAVEAEAGSADGTTILSTDPSLPTSSLAASAAVSELETMDTLLVGGVFGGLDRERSIAAYRRNNEKVRATIPSERLLIFSPADGWEPLCRFLDVPAPSSDFPRSHARDEFWAHFGGEPALA